MTHSIRIGERNMVVHGKEIEDHDIIAAYLPKKDLASYRLTGRRYDAVGARHLLDAVKFNLKTSPNGVVRPSIARHITRLQINNRGTNENEYDGAQALCGIINNVTAAGDKITQLELFTGSDRERLILDSYMAVLVNSTSSLSSLTHCCVYHTDMGWDPFASREVCIALQTFLSSLDKLEVLGFDLYFRKRSSQHDLEGLWDLYWPYAEFSCRACKATTFDGLYGDPHFGHMDCFACREIDWDNSEVYDSDCESDHGNDENSG